MMGSPKAPSSRAAVGAVQHPRYPDGQSGKADSQKVGDLELEKAQHHMAGQQHGEHHQRLGTLQLLGGADKHRKRPGLGRGRLHFGHNKTPFTVKTQTLLLQKEVVPIRISIMRDPYRSAGLSFRRQLPVPRTLKRIGPYSVLAGPNRPMGTVYTKKRENARGFCEIKIKFRSILFKGLWGRIPRSGYESHAVDTNPTQWILGPKPSADVSSPCIEIVLF